MHCSRDLTVERATLPLSYTASASAPDERQGYRAVTVVGRPFPPDIRLPPLLTGETSLAKTVENLQCWTVISTPVGANLTLVRETRFEWPTSTRLGSR